MEGVAKGAAANGGDRAGLVAFEAGFGAELQADGGVGAGLADGAPEGEEFGGGGVNFSLLEEGGRQTGSAEHRRNGNLVFAQSGGPEAGHLESVVSDFGCSHGFRITAIGKASLAECAKLLAECAKERHGGSRTAKSWRGSGTRSPRHLGSRPAAAGALAG